MNEWLALLDINSVAIGLLGGLLLTPLSAQAHCDTMDGPVAKVATSYQDVHFYCNLPVTN